MSPTVRAILGAIGDRSVTGAIREHVAVLLVSTSLVAGIVYSGLRTLDPTFADSPLYIRMYHGQPGASWAYRPLVPLLARLAPDVPRVVFSHKRGYTAEYAVAIKFASTNAVLLVAGSVVLYHVHLSFGLPFVPSLIGVILFLSNATIARFGPLPMAEAGFALFFGGVVLALQHQKPWCLVVTSLLGVFAKELVLLGIPLALLMPLPWRRRMCLASAFIPAVVAYAVAAALLNPGTVPHLAKAAHGGMLEKTLPLLLRPNTYAAFLMSFGLCWPMALYGLARADVPPLLRRWAWFVGIVISGMALGSGGLLRGPFVAFPVVIPLAAHGLWRFLRPSSTSGEDRAATSAVRPTVMTDGVRHCGP